MKTYILCILCSVCASNAVAQKVFTACDVAFKTGSDGILNNQSDDLSESDAIVTIAVKSGEVAINKLSVITKSILDSATIDQNTRINLQRLTFLQDTTQYKIYFRYRYSQTITNTFGEIVGDTITITSRRFWPVAHCFLFRTYPEIDCQIDTQIVNGKRTISLTFRRNIETDNYLHSPSDILVERVINSDNDKTTIVKNNYPELEDRILESSSDLSKEHLLKNSSARLKSSNEKGNVPFRYFIKYYLLREICGEYQLR